VRQRTARLYSYARVGEWNAQRSRDEAAKGAGHGVANLGKIAQTRIVKSSAALAVDVLGPDAMLSGLDGTEAGRYTAAMVFSAASSIYGGTDEVQRNVIAERTLGLPRENLPGKDMPYGEFLRGLGRSSRQGE
jgi:alkylation response protein AidB-like acyl-CoA dehydrogenase